MSLFLPASPYLVRRLQETMGPVDVRVQQSVAQDGKTEIAISGSLAAPDAVSKLVAALKPEAHKLAAQAQGARNGDEYPVELVLDLTGVTSIGRDGVGAVLGVLRHLGPFFPHLAQVQVRALGDVRKLLATVGRLKSGPSRELGISLEQIT